MPAAVPNPGAIRRIAARRVLQTNGGRPVVVTLSVPKPVRGWDWGCALQITGLDSAWRRPKYVFGIDGLQALELAMRAAAQAIEAKAPTLVWLDQAGEPGMPQFLPWVPQPKEQRRLKAMAEREAMKVYRQLERTHKAKMTRQRRPIG